MPVPIAPYREPMYLTTDDMLKGVMTTPWVLYYEALQNYAETYGMSSVFEIASGAFINNSPSAGSISWSKIKVKYNGIRCTITNGSTSLKWIYWEPGDPRVFSASDSFPNISAYLILIGYNNNGTFVSQWQNNDGIRGERVIEGSLASSSFVPGVEAITIVDSLPLTGEDGEIVLLTTDQQLYVWKNGTWEKVIADPAAGSVDVASFASGIRPVEIVTSLPDPGTQGRVVFLTTDSKLYRDTGTAWTAVVPATDITGQITSTQISDDAISTPKLSAGSVTVGKLSVIPESLCPDPYFKDTAWWGALGWSPDGWVTQDYAAGNVAATMGVPRCLYLPAGIAGAQKYVQTAGITLSSSGQTLRLSARIYNSSNRAAYVDVRFFDNSGSAITNLRLTSNAGSGLQNLSAQLAIPSNTASIRFIAYVGSGDTSAGEIGISCVKLDVAATADLLVDGSITAAKIASNTITAGQIAAGAINADEIAAGAVTVQKLAVVPESVIPDPYFYDIAFWSSRYWDASGWLAVDAAAGNLADTMGVGRCIRIDYTKGTIARFVGFANQKIAGPGQIVRLRARIYNSSDVNCYVGSYWYDKDNGVLQYSYITAPPGSGCQDYTLQITIPNGTTTYRVFVNNAAGMTSGEQGVSGVKMDFAATADLLVDGTITASKLNVSQLSAISANLGTISSGVVTGATVQTAASGDRIVMDSTYGIRGFNGTTEETRLSTKGILFANTVRGLDSYGKTGYTGFQMVDIDPVKAVFVFVGGDLVATFGPLSAGVFSLNLPISVSGTGNNLRLPSGGNIAIDNIQVLGAQQPAIAQPTGGTTRDIEARLAIGYILGALRAHGLIAT